MKKNQTYLKHLAVLLLTLFSFIKVNAQSDTCACKNSDTILHFFYATHCLNTFTCYNNAIPPVPIPNNPPLNGVCPCDGPDEWVQIDYKKVTCNGVETILFQRAYGVNQPRDIVDPQDPTKMIHTNFGYWLKLAQSKLFSQSGSLMYSYIYPAGCQAMAKVIYPSGTKCYYPMPEGPTSMLEYSFDNDKTVSTFPCDSSICCKLDYVYDINTNLYNLVSPQIFVACVNPPPTITTQSITCLDINGNPITHIGTVTAMGNCESYCDQAMNTLHKTSSTKSFQPFPNPLNFNIIPTPATTNIEFSDVKYIEKIEIYDLSGKKQLTVNSFDSNILNITMLKNGIHIVRVYFKDSSVRSLKIIKQ